MRALVTEYLIEIELIEFYLAALDLNLRLGERR